MKKEDFTGSKSRSPWCDSMRKEDSFMKKFSKYAEGGHVKEHRKKHEHHHEREMVEDRKLHAGDRMKKGGHCHGSAMKKGGLFSADIDKGGLHRALGVPEGKKIGMKKIEKAEHSSNAHMRKMAQWAENAIHARKKK